MTDFLALARKAPNASIRRRFLQKHQASKLRADIAACRQCELGRLRTKAVPWSGPTHGRARLVLVGEAPGAYEDREGVPFVGRAGQKLDQCLKAAGLDRTEVAIVNTLCCRPPSNRDPKNSELAACAPNFQSQLDIIGCGFGLAMGGYAASAVLGVPRGTLRVKNLRGTVTYRHGMVWTFTYHPAFVLRSPEFAGRLTADIETALSVANGEGVEPYRIKDLSPDELSPLQPGLHERLEKKGWASVYLRTIERRVTVVRNDRVRVPATAGEFPTYTLDELGRLGLFGRQQQATAEALRAIHDVKTALGGTVLA